MSDNLFEGQATQQTDEANTGDKYAALLSGIKNESGEQKYKSLEDALVALQHSQEYIPQLKSQLTGFEQKLKEQEEKSGKLSAIEESVQRLLAAQNKEPETTTQVPAGFNEQDVVKLIQDSLAKSKAEEQSISNFQVVNETLFKKYGDKAREVIAKRATEVGMTTEHLQELAKQNPQLVLGLFSSTPNVDPKPAGTGRFGAPPVVDNTAVKRPAKSVLVGASGQEQAAHLQEIRNSIYAKHGITN